MAQVDVEVVDATNKIATKLTVDVQATPAVDMGGECDPYDATGICPADAICWSEEAVTPATCQAEGPTSCPDDFGLIDLLDYASGVKWVYSGNNSTATAHAGGSCGGSGPSDAFSFTAPAAGDYTFTTSALGDGVNTVLIARQYCQLVYELACGDDMGTSAASRVRVTLAAGETVYLFVAGYDDTTLGAYTLTVSGS
jgi:hypothetical protein